MLVAVTADLVEPNSMALTRLLPPCSRKGAAAVSTGSRTCTAPTARRERHVLLQQGPVGVLESSTSQHAAEPRGCGCRTQRGPCNRRAKAVVNSSCGHCGRPQP